MTKTRRISSFITGLLMIAAALVIAINAEKNYPAVVFIFGVSLLISSFRLLVYYFTMARRMVGGRTVLYKAVIILDVALFTLNLTRVPLYCVVLYLAGMHVFGAFVDIMRALEARGLHAPSWRISLGSGLVNLCMGILCVMFIGNVAVAVVIYAVGLAYAGLMRIIQAFRKNRTVYGDVPAV